MGKWIHILGGAEIIIGGIVLIKPSLAPSWLGYPIIIIGVLTISGGFILGRRPQPAYYGTPLPRRSRWNWRVKWMAEDFWPMSRLIPMHEAARIAYRKTQGKPVARAAERFAAELGDADTRGYFLTALTDDGKTPLWGAKPGSENIREIPLQARRTCQFTDNGKNLHAPGDKQRIEYEGIYIKRSDLKRRLREMRGWGSDAVQTLG